MLCWKIKYDDDDDDDEPNLPGENNFWKSMQLILSHRGDLAYSEMFSRDLHMSTNLTS